mmetsp:Transcript_13171/g.26881  ORF Transcript_13171/g.26881 Transcript_13171/m.26881 type:complete len:207 (+) Transcript_13171:269-889(+)
MRIKDRGRRRYRRRRLLPWTAVAWPFRRRCDARVGGRALNCGAAKWAAGSFLEPAQDAGGVEGVPALRQCHALLPPLHQVGAHRALLLFAFLLLLSCPNFSCPNFSFFFSCPNFKTRLAPVVFKRVFKKLVLQAQGPLPPLSLFEEDKTATLDNTPLLPPATQHHDIAAAALGAVLTVVAVPAVVAAAAAAAVAPTADVAKDRRAP